MRSKSTKLSFIGVISVSARPSATRDKGLSRPGVSTTITSTTGAHASSVVRSSVSLWLSLSSITCSRGVFSPRPWPSEKLCRFSM